MMNYIQYMQEGGDFAVQEGTLRVDPQTNRTQTYKNGQWQDNVIITPWSNQGTNRMNNGQQEVYFDGKWMPVHDQKWYEKLKEEDWYTLGSIVGDLASLGLSFTGFSPAAAATGALSTTSQLIGDIKRDGFQAKDLGWAALGYGLDAISLVPFAGAAAQMAKAAPKLAKAAPIVLGLGTTALSGLGIGTSIPAFKKVVNGEKLTMDDYRLMTNALMSIVGLGRQAKGVYDVVKGEGFLPVPENLNNKQEIDEQLRIKSQTEERLARQEERLNEEWEQRQASNPNWKFTMAQAAANVQMRDKARMLEQTGAPRAWRKAVVKKSPIGISEPNPMLDHILLINRVGGDGQILWQNGTLVWPHRRQVVEGINGNYLHDRPTVHFTTHRPVTDHLGGSWSQGSTTIMVPMTEMIRSNGNPMAIDPMDTYWNNSTSMQVPASSVRVFTGSLQEATKARMQGAQVIFSKDANRLAREINRLQTRWNEICNKYQYDMDKVWGDPEALEINERLGVLKQENYQLHKSFTDEQQKSHPLTEEDYKMLEAATGLKAGVETVQNGKLSYHSTPTKHSNEWWNFGTEMGQGVKHSINQYLFDLKRAVAPDGFDDAKDMDDIIHWIKNERMSPSHLLILQQSVQKAKPEDLKELQKIADIVPDDWPNVDKLRKIAAGQIVYKYTFGGKLNYLNYFQHG